MRAEQFESSGNKCKVGSLLILVVVSDFTFYFIATEILYYVTRPHSSSFSLLLIKKKKYGHIGEVLREHVLYQEK